MNYHNPAGQWKIFGMTDFESYCDKSVVKSAFHHSVPETILKAYNVAEYMMAHAYYCYEMFDEAFSKILLLLEMSMKQKCDCLGIPTETQRKKGPPKNRPLEQLINEVCDAEPTKNIREDLHWFRERRNSKMHPKEHFFMGANGNYIMIKFVVSLINKLFISEQLLDLSTQLIQAENQKLRTFVNALFVLEKDKNRYLIEKVKIEDALIIDGTNHYFVVVSPLSNGIANQLETYNYLPQITTEGKNFKIEENTISFTELRTNREVHIYPTTNPLDIQFYQNYLTEKTQALNKKSKPLFYYSSPENYVPHVEFMYNWLHLVG